MHYKRWKRTGDPTGTSRLDQADRFWIKVDKTEECWLWTGSRNNKGYGQFSVGGRAGRPRLAHRIAYEFTYGAIDQKLHLDHLCRTPACVRPDHLQPVTPLLNNVRGRAARYGRSEEHAMTHCKNDHEYTPENTILRADGRRCRTCANERNRRWRAERKES